MFIFNGEGDALWNQYQRVWPERIPSDTTDKFHLAARAKGKTHVVWNEIPGTLYHILYEDRPEKG